MANVSVANTPGLYQINGTNTILTSAQQLLALLDNYGNVNFALDPLTNNTTIISNFVGTGGGGGGNTSPIVNLVGDVTSFGVTGLPITATIANTGVSAGVYGNATYSAQVTVNSKGQVTNVANVLIATSGGGNTYSNTNVAAYLAGSVSVGNIASTNGFFWSNGQPYTTANITNTYGNTQVAAYLPIYSGSLDNSSSIINLAGQVAALQSNTGTLQGEINSTNANLAAFETYANSTFGTSNYGNANVTAYLPTYTGSLNNSTTIIGINSNVSAANAAIASINANLASFETYANATFQTSASAYSNVNAAAYLAGSVSVGNIKSTNGYFWANGTAYSTGGGSGTYGNANVAAYLPTYSGNIGGTLTTGAQNYITTLNGVSTIGTSATGLLTFDGLGVSGLGIQATQTTVSGTNFRVFNGNISAEYNQSYTPGSGYGGYITAANNITATGNVIGANFLFANGQPVASNTYGNANVAAYLPTYSGSMGAGTGITVSGQLTATVLDGTNGLYVYDGTGKTLFTADTVDGVQVWNKYPFLANANVTVTSGNHFIGDGSLLTNLPVQPGTYSNTNVAAYLTGSITVGNIASTNGYFWANGTAYSTGGGSSFTGNLAGQTLYDGANNYITANAYPFSTPSTAVGSGYYQTYLRNKKPTYSAGVLQAPGSTNGVVTTISQEANIALQSAYGSTTTTLIANENYLQVWPVTANSMSNSDRIRAIAGIAEVDLNGKTWGVMSSTAQNLASIVGSNGVASIIGNGQAATAVGQLASAQIVPQGGSANVQYATGVLSTVSFSANASNSYTASNIAYARLIGGYISPTGNLTIQNAIGLHTYSGWAGSGGVVTNQRYAVLNEDTNTIIQSAGNMVLTSGSGASLVFQDGTSQSTAAVAYGNTQVAAYLAANTDPTISNLNANTQQQAGQINSINANVSAFETYANITYQFAANAYSNVNTAAYLAGSVSVGNITSTNGYFWANGTAYSTGGGSYGNTQVAAYLPTATVNFGGNIATVSGNASIKAASNLVDMSVNTGALVIPTGSTAQRPTSNVAGSIRFNTSTGNPEWFSTNSMAWQDFSQPYTNTYSVGYLIVAGGGGTGQSDGGGGGAGGVLTGTTGLTPGTTYSATVGAGGAGVNSNSLPGNNGSNSSFAALTTAIGGGGGGTAGNGQNGGSGGGGGNAGAGPTTGGSGTSGQGYAGGSGSGATGTSYPAAGGGGAGGVGGNSDSTNAGNGGIGLQSSITGTAVYYGGGGGGAAYTTGTPGSGGSGGGGNGASFGNNGVAGTANTGGGAGGSSGGGTGSNGGSGVVILSVPTANYTGVTTGSPTITTSGSNTIITFTASGSYTA